MFDFDNKTIFYIACAILIFIIIISVSVYFIFFHNTEPFQENKKENKQKIKIKDNIKDDNIYLSSYIETSL